MKNKITSKEPPTTSLGHTRGDSDVNAEPPRSPDKAPLKDAYDRLMNAVVGSEDLEKAKDDLILALYKKSPGSSEDLPGEELKTG